MNAVLTAASPQVLARNAEHAARAAAQETAFPQAADVQASA